MLLCFICSLLLFTPSRTPWIKSQFVIQTRKKIEYFSNFDWENAGIFMQIRVFSFCFVNEMASACHHRCYSSDNLCIVQNWKEEKKNEITEANFEHRKHSHTRFYLCLYWKPKKKGQIDMFRILWFTVYRRRWRRHRRCSATQCKLYYDLSESEYIICSNRRSDPHRRLYSILIHTP